MTFRKEKDLVLKYLKGYENGTEAHISELFTQSQVRAGDIISELLSDGYIMSDVYASSNDGNVDYYYSYRLTDEGLLFLTKGGYRRGFYSERKKVIWKGFLWVLLILGPAAIAYCPELRIHLIEFVRSLFLQ